ncbi:MAG: VOC family protein [Candidatus Rokubacteria bacterium]|nr:VOC family protein [Candidatus Rokubacteria bacterium]
MGDRGILFDHIAIAVERMADTPAVLVGALGGVPDSGAPSRMFNWGCRRFAGGGRLEIIEPRGADGFLHRFLAQRGPGIHHVTFRVPDLSAVCARAEAHGYKIVGYDDSHPGWKEAFLHPKQALGIVVQMAQSADAANPSRWQPPAGPANAPTPATVLGLRMRARSLERARTQWELVLEGEAAEGTAGEVIYRWPGSPMRLAVEVDPAAEEGPIGIELEAPAPIAFPAAAHPALCAAFLPRVSR